MTWGETIMTNGSDRPYRCAPPSPPSAEFKLMRCFVHCLIVLLSGQSYGFPPLSSTRRAATFSSGWIGVWVIPPIF
eukprot:5904684-Pyramimonas_sp.AAC.1